MKELKERLRKKRLRIKELGEKVKALKSDNLFVDRKLKKYE